MKKKIIFPDIEEMKCNSCNAVTGHRIVDGKWACVICTNHKKTNVRG